MTLIKREVPIFTYGIMSLIVIIAWYAQWDPLTSLATRIMRMSTIIAAFALTIGAINLVRFHSRHIMRRTPVQWYWSAYVLCLFIPFVVLGIVMGPTYPLYDWIFQNVNMPLGTAFWGLLAPYIVTASYRAFRIKSVESTILALCCFFVLLRNAPLGGAIWSGFPVIGDWISDYPQTMGSRVFWVGVAIGSISLYIRTLRGVETAHLGFTGDE